MSDDTGQKQARRDKYRRALLCAMLLVGLSGLAACGKKAGMIDAPPSVTEDNFPRTYPDTSLDPKPAYIPEHQAP